MTLTDEFFKSKVEVSNTLAKLSLLHQKWLKLQEEDSDKAQTDTALAELRNAIRSVEWEIEDLEETLVIVEHNPKKFKIEDVEIDARRKFINESREEVRVSKEVVLKLSIHDNKTKDQSLIETIRTSVGDTKYSRLETTEADVPFYIQQHMSREEVYQPTTLPSLDALKELNNKFSKHVGERSVMLAGKEMEVESMTSSLRGSVRNMVENIPYPSMQRKRWLAIGASAGITMVVVLLIIIL